MLEVKNAGFAVGSKWLVQDVSYTFEPGKCYMLCGPNGAGKSTLLKILGLELLLGVGEVFYNGKLAQQKRKNEYATFRAVLSQHIDISFPLLVEEVIMMGRYPHFTSNPGKKDRAICAEVAERLGVTSFLKRNFLTLSGGEKQRVQFARVLSQIWEMPLEGNRILLLDEPISSLDLKYQFDFLQHLKMFMNDRTIVIAILHDLNLALNYADEVLLLQQGRLFAHGKPAEVLSPQNIEAVFNLKSQVYQLPEANLLWIRNT
jgi:iron complex transport system ATP-binding protein